MVGELVDCAICGPFPIGDTGELPRGTGSRSIQVSPPYCGRFLRYLRYKHDTACHVRKDCYGVAFHTYALSVTLSFLTQCPVFTLEYQIVPGAPWSITPYSTIIVTSLHSFLIQCLVSIARSGGVLIYVYVCICVENCGIHARTTQITDHFSIYLVTPIQSPPPYLWTTGLGRLGGKLRRSTIELAI